MSHSKFHLPSIRLLIALLLFTTATILLAACGRDEATPVAAAAPTEKPIGGLEAASTQAAATSAPAATPAPTSAPSHPSQPSLAGHVTIWHSWAQAQGDALTAALAQLKQAQPGIQIDSVFVAPDLLVTSYTNAVKSGNAPDLLLAPNWSLGALADASAILNLDSRVGG